MIKFQDKKIILIEKGKKTMQDLLQIEITFNYDDGELTICQIGGYNPCSYHISFLYEISKCVSDYVERYL